MFYIIICSPKGDYIMQNVALIGLGPHAKRIYINYLKKTNTNLVLVVDLDSQRQSIRQFLDENGFSDTKIYTLSDTYRDFESLPEKESNKLLAICQTLEITHIIISTEPKSHFMFLEFALKNNINVLTDKPITVTKDMTNLKNIEKVRQQYYYLLELAKKSKSSCKIMCQRQYHRGYEKIKEILTEAVFKYKIPITNIDIFYSDGAWEMPHDMDKENHPYKYGYGELFHSGYHFIDLLSDFIKINDLLGENKKIVKGEVYSKVFTPDDEMNIITIEDYKRIFNNQELPEYYKKGVTPKFKKYGEKDYHGLMTFYNKDDFILTNVSLNLLHNGVSMRNWVETKDFYKNNGRIRHERINIEIGHLLNIQVHSYQSKEIKNRTDEETAVGGLEHFDIYIFYNPLIKNKPFEEIHLSDMYSEEEKKDILGFNELSRETFLKNFLHNLDCRGDIKDQAIGIEILYSCSKEVYNHYKNLNKVEKIKIRNENTHLYCAKRLQQYSNCENQDYEKQEICTNIFYKSNYTFYEFMSYINDKSLYEVFISLDDSKNVAGCLLYKTFRNKFLAYIYFRILKFLVEKKSMFFIESLIENHL